MSVNILNMSALSPIVISSTSSSPLLCLPFIPLEDIPPLSLEAPRGVLEIQVDQFTKAVYKVSPHSTPHFLYINGVLQFEKYLEHQEGVLKEMARRVEYFTCKKQELEWM